MRPIALTPGGTDPSGIDALPLAGGPLGFAACEIYLPAAAEVLIARAPLEALRGWAGRQGDAVRRRIETALATIAAPRPPFAGIALDRPAIMGILNVTPDSFYAAGRDTAAEDAVARARAHIEAGADMIDVGGESTRPDAPDLPEEDELARVLPVLEGLRGLGAPVSIDTRKAELMRQAVARGAAILNDVSALTDDPDSLRVAAGSGAAVVLMHKPGAPSEMEARADYGHAPYEVAAYLARRVAACEAAGIPRARIAVDPGFGFGKRVAHNAQLIAHLAMLHGLGCAVLVGASRKRFVSGGRGDDAAARLPGSLAAAVATLNQGAQIFRVHDVAETRQALDSADLWRHSGDVNG